MRRIVYIQFLLLAVVSLAHGWGNEAHIRINRAAVEIIPGQFGAYLDQFADTLSLHAPDPDSWKRNDPDEGYRHYIDIDLYSRPPFDNLPVELDQLVARFGEDNVKRWGIGPYRIAEYSQKIIDMFKTGQWEESLIPLAALGHYVADLHMPLHVVANYNGQLTGNDGIHFRWEVPLIDEYIDTVIAYDVLENNIAPFEDPLDEAFYIVRESYREHFTIIQADSIARESLSAQDQEILSGYDPLPEDTPYYDILFRESGQLAQQQVNRAATRVAAYWYFCWVAAGRPVPPGD